MPETETPQLPSQPPEHLPRQRVTFFWVPPVASAPLIVVSFSLADRIAALAARWRQETGHLSSIEQKAMHPAYQEIIATGIRGVPYVLRELKERGGHWFWALHHMTGINLGSQGQGVEELRNLWLAWGRGQGYLGL